MEKLKKLRVLHILDELNTGGAEKIVVSYFCNIDRSKQEWEFVITEYDDKHKRGVLEDLVEELGGKIYRVPRKRKNYLANVKAVDRIIKHGKFDIVHSHLDELSALYILSAKRYGVPVRICHSHLSGADRGLCVELLCKLLKPILNKVTTDMFACGRDAAISLWGKENVLNQRVYILNNAIDTAQFSYSESIRKQKRAELGLGTETVYGTVGRMSYQKNSEFIVQIYNQIRNHKKNCKFLFVGVGEREESVKELAKEYGLSDMLFLESRNDVNQLMMAMDVFLLPSRFEGLPIVLVEAQCAGLTCFVSDAVTKEIHVNPNVYYYRLDKGPDEWARFIIDHENSEFDRKDGMDSIVKAGYQIATEAKKLENYYMRAVEKKCI